MTEMVAELEGVINIDGQLTDEFIASKEARWVKRDGRPVWIVCGDERGTEAASATELQQLMPEALPIQEGGLSIYGQVVGVTLNMLTVGVAQHGESYYDAVGGFQKLLRVVSEEMQADTSEFKVLPAQHSDAAKEQAANDSDEASFCIHGYGALGCAYCMSAGSVINLVAADPNVMDTGRRNVEAVTGMTDDPDVSKLQTAAAYVSGRIGADFAFDRQDYRQSGLPVQVLEGIPHMAAATTGYIVNLDPQSVGQAGYIYRGDVAGVALLVRRQDHDKQLDAGLLIKSQILQAAAVRAALAGGNPDDIGFGVRGGSYREALAKIAELEATL